MKYRAEIFDLVQYLFDTTGFNDHQLHCIVRFRGRVNAGAMANAFRLLLLTAPALSRVYREAGGASYWEDAPAPADRDLFQVTDNLNQFDRFTCSKTDAALGPQLKGCLFRGEGDALSVVGNHMVMDGAGFKECVYLLSRLYSALVRDPAYRPDFVLDGDRGYGKILSGLKLKDRMNILFTRSGDNNASGAYKFPLPGGDAEPFILTHELAPEKYGAIVEYAKKHGATLNDVILTAYLRVLSGCLGLNGAPLSLPLMIDMRRYLEDRCIRALTNSASMEIITAAVLPGEVFGETLAKISATMKSKKEDYFGLNTFVKLQSLFALCHRRRAFRLLEKHLHNPNICITNIGLVDDGKLLFEGAEIVNAVITGSIKYRPHFQMSLSSYRDKLTFAVNLYGSTEDREKIVEFFGLMDRELAAAVGSD